MLSWIYEGRFKIVILYIDTGYLVTERRKPCYDAYMEDENNN